MSREKKESFERHTPILLPLLPTVQLTITQTDLLFRIILIYLPHLISWVICDHSPDQTRGYWGVPKIGGYHGQGVNLLST